MKVEKTMKKPILIIAAGMVAVSLIWLVDKTFLAKESQTKTAANHQDSEAEGQSSPTEQRTTDNPTSKPPVYDLSNKAHWYDPETTIGFWGSSKTLAEWLEPFKPKAEEFQIIAQYENERKKLEESLSEDEYYSVEGRKRLIDEVIKLHKQLREDLGLERTQFYAEVRELVSGYYYTWKVLTVNGISEERVAEFRDLADEFNQQMHGRPLFRGDKDSVRPPPRAGFSSGSLNEQRQLSKTFQDRIEKEFGSQVLDDVLSLRGEMFFMDKLDLGNPGRIFSLAQDPKQRERLEKMYDFKFLEADDGSAERHKAETERMRKRKKEFMEEWVKHHAQQQAELEESSGDSP